jgi:nucleolar protein 14
MKPKSGGSALKKLKQSISENRIQEKLQKVGKRKSKNAQQAQLVQRRDARSELRNLQKKNQQNNPFEQRFSKQKHDVLGRNQKGLQGRPGQVRARAEEIRKNTIGIELKTRNRENLVIDKRIGENDATLSVEDKMLQRMMKEKSRKTNTALFNLEEEEELTHMGQSLSVSGFGEAGLVEVERDDDSDKGEIDADMVRYGHFGGFQEKEEKDGKKSRGEIMKEIIAKSKQHKRERQMIKEQNLDLQDEVDAELDEIRGLLEPMNAPASQGKMVVNSDRLRMIHGEIERPSEQESVPKDEEDDYDRFVKELTFDKRAKPTDRTKTEEELALEAKKELEELEAKRIRRMKGIPDEEDGTHQKTSRPSQADDLGDDDYEAHVDQTIEDEEEMALTYKDGVLVNQKIFMKHRDESDGSDDSDDSDASKGDSGNDLESDASGSESDEAELHASSDASAEDSDSESMDSDQRLLEEMATDSEEEDLPPKAKRLRTTTEDTSLPYTFECPNNYEEFEQLLSQHSLENQLIIVKRLRILYSVKLAKENREKMNRLLIILLKHSLDLSSNQPLNLPAIMGFMEHVVELGRELPHALASWCQSRILFLRDRLNKQLSTQKKKRSHFPSIGDLLLFKNLTRIYSVSDLQHPVMTPTQLLLAQYLEQAYILDDTDVFAGLFLCRLLYQVFFVDKYVDQSKRYIPEAINYLYALLLRMVPSDKKSSILPDFKVFKVHLSIENFKSDVSALNFGVIFGENFTLNDSYRLAILQEVIDLMHHYCKLYASSSVAKDVFQLFVDLLNEIPEANSSIQVFYIHIAINFIGKDIITSAS